MNEKIRRELKIMNDDISDISDDDTPELSILGKRKFDQVLNPPATGPGSLVGSQRRKIDKKASIWFLTWNDYPRDWKQKIRRAGNLLNWCCQEETGTSGNKHIQGVIVFYRDVSRYLLQMRCPGCHWEICRNLKSAELYCMKLETRTGECWVKGFKVPLVSKPHIRFLIKELLNILGC